MTARPHNHGPRSLRTLSLALLASLAVSACDRGRGDDEFSAVNDTTGLVESQGEVSLTEDGAIQGEVTSGMYRRWLQAKQAMLRAGVSLPGSQRLRGYGVAETDRLVAQLEKNARARSAIENAGMSVRSWVVTGVALERQLALATGPQRRAMEDAARMPLDTGLVQPYPGQVPAPAPLPEPVPDTLLQPLPPQPAPTRPVPADTRPVPAPMPVPAPSRPATPRPAPRDTIRLEPIPAPAPARPESTTTPTEPISAA